MSKIIQFFKQLFKKKRCIKDDYQENQESEDYMPLSDEELYAILETFHRPSDIVMQRPITQNLIKYGVRRRGIFRDAINDGILVSITFENNIRYGLTNNGARIWQGLFQE